MARRPASRRRPGPSPRRSDWAPGLRRGTQMLTGFGGGDRLLDRGGGYAFALEEVEDSVPPGVEGAQVPGGPHEGGVAGLDRGRVEGQAEPAQPVADQRPGRGE